MNMNPTDNLPDALSVDLPEKAVGNRQSTMDCMAKAIRAFLLCNTLSIKELMNKADISERTAFRVVDCLLKERLVAREPGMEVRLRRVYRWNPDTP